MKNIHCPCFSHFTIMDWHEFTKKHLGIAVLALVVFSDCFK